MFNRKYNLSVNQADLKGATALHFAVISMHNKNVQALIKLGADPNFQDVDGNTPLHLTIQTLATEPKSFEKLKNIGKELLFCGASRFLKNEQGQTPGDLLSLNQELLIEDDFRKMRYVLT